jgi:hypothetical protein
MVTQVRSAAFLLATMLSLGPHVHAQQGHRSELLVESRVWVDGTSNREDWTVDATELRGYVVLEPAGASWAIREGRFTVTARRMISKHGVIMDRLMHGALRANAMTKERLGVGFIGSGFNTKFTLHAFTGVRDADVLGYLEPDAEERGSRSGAGARAGDRRCARRIARSRRWSPTPHRCDLAVRSQSRPDRERRGGRRRRSESGRGRLRGIACEKPLARNVAEAKRRAEAREEREAESRLPGEPALRAAGRDGAQAALGRGAALTGRPYLARAAEEHSGPHMPWFWQGSCRAAAC